MIDADDDVFFQAAPIHIRAVMSELRRLEKPCKRLILAGGGNIGMRLARATKERHRVKVIERDLGRSKRIAEDLERTIVLAVAVLPMLGVGGMQLYRAEKPGPMKDTKLTARITETAKALWHIYLWLTVACALAHWGAGMTLFDAVCHALATVAISGFSTHDLSMSNLDCTTIEMIAVVF